MAFFMGWICCVKLIKEHGLVYWKVTYGFSECDSTLFEFVVDFIIHWHLTNNEWN